MRGVIASVVAVFTIASAFGGGATGQELNKRVKELEKKTDYYLKRTRTITKTIRPRLRLCQDIEVLLDPRIDVAGVTYAWLVISINSQSPADQLGAWFSPENFGFPCRVFPLTGTGGTVSGKKFCSFDVDPGNKFLVRLGDVSGSCTITSATIELKLTIIEIPEPD